MILEVRNVDASYGETQVLFGVSLAAAFYSTLLTVLLAPLVTMGLMKLRPLLGIRVSRRF